MTDPWHFVDAVYAITLDTAIHRQSKLLAEMRRVGLNNKLQLMKVQRDPESGVRGCYESHARAWAQARAAGHQCVLVVEDDVFFSDDYEKHLLHIVHFLHSGIPWHLLLLGWTPLRSKPVHPHISAIIRGTALHAYLVSPTALQRGIPPFRGLPIDIELCYVGTNKAPRNNKKLHAGYNDWLSFALKPMIAFQRYDGTSSTGNSTVANQFKARVATMRFVASIADHADVRCFVPVACMIGFITVSLIVLLILLLVQRNRN
jgi:hypothetical protein